MSTALELPMDPWKVAGPFHPIPELPAGLVGPAEPFLRATFADPDDLTVRLAFADWLEEHDVCENRRTLIRLGAWIEGERTRVLAANLSHDHPDWVFLCDEAERERNLIKTGDAFGGWWNSPWKGWQLETRSWVVVIGGASYPRCVVRAGFVTEVDGPLSCLLDEGGFSETLEPTTIQPRTFRHIMNGYLPTERGEGSELTGEAALTAAPLAGALGVTWPLSAAVPREVNRAVEQVDHKSFVVPVGRGPGVGPILMWDGSVRSHVVPSAVARRLRGEVSKPDPVGVWYPEEAAAVYDIARAWAEVLRSRRDFPTRFKFLEHVLNADHPGHEYVPPSSWMDEVDNHRPYTGSWVSPDDEEFDYEPTGHGDDEDFDEPEPGEGNPDDWMYEPHPADNL